MTIVLLLAALALWGDLYLEASRSELTYGEFRRALASSQVEQVYIGPELVTGTLSTGQTFKSRRVNDPGLVELLAETQVAYGAEPAWRLFLYGALAPGLAVVGLCYFGYQHYQNPLKKFGRRGRRLLVPKKPSGSFDEVAGCDDAKAELREIADFLAAPDKYHKMGASVPRGTLLSGPPGTGKTLLAKALAAEAGVPFFSLSGSDFVEMYVGVGAARVRGLFEQARKQAPCIIFIDEIDALGKNRESGKQTHDEREQTLNQLLVEMDGFDGDSLVIIVGATNRPDVIDPALLRPGRFDRQITVDAPDKQGRLEILEVHARSKRLCPDTSLQQLAESTAGMAGADLANILNEAALLAAREDEPCISNLHLQDAAEKVLAGPVRSNRLLTLALKERVAYHEIGHALVAHHSPGADPVHKISIVPRGKAALGYTLQKPAGESYLLTENELRDRIRVLLGGRAAEQLIFEVISTGAENDLQRATAMARRMVGHFGMGKGTGLLHAGRSLEQSSSFLADQIDQEAAQILNELFEEAVTILATHRHQLLALTDRLMQQEVLDAEDFEKALLEI